MSDNMDFERDNVGFIAQELELAMPTVVNTDTNGFKVSLSYNYSIFAFFIIY